MTPEEYKQFYYESKALHALFPLQDHEIRRGGGYGDNAQWYVYVQRQRIIDRLNELFPMQWATDIERVQTESRHDKNGLLYNLVTVTASITINGIKRAYNGSATDNPIYEGSGKARVIVVYDGENTEKAAATDAFKRAASKWGIGLYLLDGDIIKANDENAAKRIFAERYAMLVNREAPVEKKPAKESSKNTVIQDTWATPENLRMFFDVWNNQSLSDSDICRLAGINTPEEWGTKYATGKDASAAIRKAMNAEIESNTEKSATFRYMSYVGSKGTLQFLTHPDGTRDNTLALLYEGRGGITKMSGNDELYNALNLAQYDDVKGSNTVTDFIPMAIPVEFSYVTEVSKRGESYNKITGIVNVPEIAF